MLPPGGEGEIKVTLDPKGAKGKIHKRIVVYSNDPEQPQFALTMQGSLLVDMVAQPAMVSLADLPLGKPGSEVFTLHRTEGSTAEIRSVRVEDEESFSVRPVTAEGDAHAAYEVRFRGRPTVGTSSTRVVVETSGDNTPELSIVVRASAAKNLRYAEQIRFFSRDGRPQPYTLRISARDGNAPRVPKLDDPDGLLEIEVLPGDGAVASVRLTPRESEAGTTPDGGWHPLIVHTTDREQPRLELKYRFEPERAKAKR